MKTPSPFTSAYLRFLRLAAAVQAVPGIDDFDANEKALFDTVVLTWSQGKPFTVREAINQQQLGSPATLHKRLSRLIAKGLILAEFEGTDRRTKYLRPSENGLAYIENLSEQMLAVQISQ